MTEIYDVNRLESHVKLAVLVVDDEEAIGRVFKRLLRDIADVTWVASGREALELLEVHTFDRIFCDLNMEGMSGIHFFKTLAERDREASHQVIFVTGGIYSKQDRAFLSAAENPVLLKPFGHRELLALLSGNDSG